MGVRKLGRRAGRSLHWRLSGTFYTARFSKIQNLRKMDSHSSCPQVLTFKRCLKNPSAIRRPPVADSAATPSVQRSAEGNGAQAPESRTGLCLTRERLLAAGGRGHPSTSVFSQEIVTRKEKAVGLKGDPGQEKTARAKIGKDRADHGHCPSRAHSCIFPSGHHAPNAEQDRDLSSPTPGCPLVSAGHGSRTRLG